MRSALLCLSLLAASILPVASDPLPPAQLQPAPQQSGRGGFDALGREVLGELIAINTTAESGSVTAAAERVAARFIAAGFPKDDVQIVGAADKPTKKNLVARYRSRGGDSGAANSSARKPILLIAHLDVVEARREDWSFDPFKLTEKDGYFYGRGTLDIKGAAATVVTALIRLRQEQWTPDRDVILALTADEEGGPDNGVQWLLANRRELIDAEYCLNVDAGGPEFRGGKLTALDVQAAEKVYASFSLTVKNPGGHSSQPVKENAIYRLAAALQRLAAFDFPITLNDITRTYFERMAPLSGASGDDMRAIAKQPIDMAAAARMAAKSALYNALLRTTCVATRLEGGHADNALPQTARATVNCRILPGHDPAEVQRTLAKVIADDQVTFDIVTPPTASPASPLRPEVFIALETAARATWSKVGPNAAANAEQNAKGVPIVPFMETGATDGLYLRNAGVPVYATNGIAFDPDDYRAHGKDERILVASFYEGLEFSYQMIRAAAGSR
jgi:acetylornithine deacetylase/succinyl-diaminopimelate desuccinylase-like protein